VAIARDKVRHFIYHVMSCYICIQYLYVADDSAMFFGTPAVVAIARDKVRHLSSLLYADSVLVIV
jgi:hypothetical protein